LRAAIAVLAVARFLAYPFDMSASLRHSRLALTALITVFNSRVIY